MEAITSSAQTLMSIVQKLEALIEASAKSKGGGSDRSTGIEKTIKEIDSEKKQLEKEIAVKHSKSDTESAF